MRVRIKKASKPGYWYRLHIGQVFNVEPTPASQDDYRVVGVGPTGTACWIDKSDCVLVVRVPKELRPPSRFKAFRAENRIRDRFVVKGLFRKPKVGELYYSSPCSLSGRSFVHECDFLNETDGPRVIVERAP